MRIQHNIMAMNAYRNYTNNVSAMQKNLEKLSSGYKINRAGDDAAGLAISEKMRAQITGLETAQKNAKDGISLVQTAEGALTEVHDMLNRMVELATQSANGTYDNTTDRVQMQKEVNQLLEEIDRIADSSNFNGINLLDGTLGLNKTAFTTGSIQAADLTDVTSTVVVGHTPASSTANAVTKLHTDTTNGVIGSFTVYLNQASLGAVAGTKSQLKVTVAGIQKTISGTAATTAMTAAKIATQMLSSATGAGGGGMKFFVVKSDGTKGFAKDSAAAKTFGDKGALIYVGATDSKGNITYTLTSYMKSSSASENIANASDLTADKVASGAFIDLNFDVAIEAVSGKGALTVNAANVGTNPTNSVMKKPGQMGSIELDFDATKLEHGMEIDINGVKKSVKLDKNGTGAIDLSDLVDDTGKITAANKDKAMAKIAAAFKGAVTGVDVGVTDAGKLTLSEQAGATSAVYNKMKDINTFKGMVKVTSPAVTAGATVKVGSASAIKNGDALNISMNGKNTKIIFTDDMSGKSDTADTKYVDIKNNTTATAIAQAISSKFTSGVTVQSDNVTLKIDGADSSVLGRGLTLQIGDTAASYNQLSVSVQNMHTNDLGVGGLDISTEAAAQNAISKIKDAINTVSDVRGTLGATQNRLDHTINNLSVMTENIQDAESSIRDTDVAEEMMAYTKNNILIQSAQAMLAQANQVPQGVLQLLQ